MNKETEYENIVNIKDHSKNKWKATGIKEKRISPKNIKSHSLKFTFAHSPEEQEKAIMNITSGSHEQAYSQESEGGNMSNHYEDFIKESIKDIKEDFKEKENRFYNESLRINSQFKEREERIVKDADDREKRYQEEMKRLSREAIEREERSRNDSKEREERILQLMNSMESRINYSLQDVKDSVNRAETRIDTATSHIQSMAVSTVSLIDQNKWGRKSFYSAMIGIIVAIILGIISIFISSDSDDKSDQAKTEINKTLPQEQTETNTSNTKK